MKRSGRVGKLAGADSLFGETPDEGKGNGHRTFVEHFDSEFRKRYGTKYPFRGRDFAHIRDIVQAVGADDSDAIRRIIDAYFAERGRRYEGHEIRWLLADLARFVARSKSVSGGVAGGARVAPGNRADAVL